MSKSIEVESGQFLKLRRLRAGESGGCSGGRPAKQVRGNYKHAFELAGWGRVRCDGRSGGGGGVRWVAQGRAVSGPLSLL